MREKIWVFALMAMLLTGLLTSLLIPERYVLGMIDAERHSNYAFLGYESARNTEARAERWFDTLFVRTGVMDASYRATVPESEEDPEELKAFAGILQRGLEWVQGRMRVLWASSFQFMVRISVAMMWIPLTILVVVPFMVDSLVSRKIKSSSFAITSPHLQQIGARSIFWLTLGYLLLQLLPMKLHPMWTPLYIGLVSAGMWLGISQFAKRA